VPTVAGLVLFGRDERVAELLPRSSIIATRLSGETLQSAVIERVEITGNLLSLYERTLRFVERYCDLWDSRPRIFPAGEVSGSPVVARANYHRAVILEALANQLTHRDLVLRDQVTRLNVYDQSIEFVNPRRSVGFSAVAQKAIRYGMRQQLNPQIASLFASPGYGLKLPTGGLPMLLRESRLFSNRRSDIVMLNDEFRLRIYGAW
jgi:predicted HTH transcriptional regulator